MSPPDPLAQRRHVLFAMLTALEWRYAPGPEPPLIGALRVWLHDWPVGRSRLLLAVEARIARCGRSNRPGPRDWRRGFLRQHYRFTISSVAALLILTGCTEIPFRQSSEDQRITHDVRAALAADKTPTLNQVNASAYGGFVILTGWANLAAAERAREIAQSVAGVRGVVDQITAPETREVQ